MKFIDFTGRMRSRERRTVTHSTDAEDTHQPLEPVETTQTSSTETPEHPVSAQTKDSASELGVPQASAAAVYAPHPSHLQTENASSEPAQPPHQSTTGQYAPGATSFVAPGPAPEYQTRKQSKTGIWVAGIAIGAVIGGVVGGGVSSAIMSNQAQLSFQGEQASGTLTIENAENATNVSAVAAVATDSVVTLEVSGSEGAGSGSGVIYSKDGYIVTNAHVVTLDGAAGADPTVRVWLADGRILQAKVVGVDPFADLAVVKVEAENLTPIAIANSNKVRVGDLAVAIGAPLNLSNTVTSGVVSALNRGITVGSEIIPDDSSDDQAQSPNSEEQLPWFRFGDPNAQQQQSPSGTSLTVTLPVIQTDASINPGNSGGALLNSNAELIGINVAIASNATDSSTAGSVGLGFAIPSNMVTRVADALIAGKQPSHGLLGVNISDAGGSEGQTVAGALIAEVAPGGAADSAGLKKDDVIIAIDGIRTDSGTTASALVRMNAGGSEVTITYVRDGKQYETPVTLGTLGSS